MSKRAVHTPCDLIAFLVHRAVVAAAEQRQIRERGRASAGPVPQMMALAERYPAARETAAPVAVLECPPQGRWNGPVPGAHLHQTARLVMAHPHAAGVAREALRRFRGNAHSVFEDGLPWMLGLRQHGRIDVHHHLIAFTRRTRVEPVVQRRFREERQGIGPLLWCGRRLIHRVGRDFPADARPRIERLASSRDRLQEQGAHLGLQPATQDHRAVLVMMDVQRSACVPSRGLTALGAPVDLPPAPHDALHVGRRPRTPDPDQTRIGIGRRHPRQGAHLRVGELPAGKRLGQVRQGAEGTRDTDPLAGGTRIESDPPGQPGGARGTRG